MPESGPPSRPSRSQSHYGVLGVATDADQARIRAAYLALARRHHPDVRGPGSSSARMAQINQAWAVLSDPVRRAAYDRTLGVEPGGATVRAAPGGFRPLHDERDDEWIDPRLEDDTATGAPAVARSALFAPLLLAVAAFAAVGAGIYLDVAGFVQIGVTVGVMAALAFVGLPFVALVRSSRADRS